VPSRKGSGVDIVNMRHVARFFPQFAWEPNARFQPPLEAVGCKRLFGSDHPSAPE